MNRKIVNAWLNEKCIVVLCEDGTLWSLGEYRSVWDKLPSVPTDEQHAENTRLEVERLNRMVQDFPNAKVS